MVKEVPERPTRWAQEQVQARAQGGIVAGQSNISYIWVYSQVYAYVTNIFHGTLKSEPLLESSVTFENRSDALACDNITAKNR